MPPDITGAMKEAIRNDILENQQTLYTSTIYDHHYDNYGVALLPPYEYPPGYTHYPVAPGYTHYYLAPWEAVPDDEIPSSFAPLELIVPQEVSLWPAAYWPFQGIDNAVGTVVFEIEYARPPGELVYYHHPTGTEYYTDDYPDVWVMIKEYTIYAGTLPLTAGQKSGIATSAGAILLLSAFLLLGASPPSRVKKV